MSEQGRRKTMAELVESGEYVLRPGEYLSATGVLMGHNADRDIPRFGADETDMDATYAQDFPVAAARWRNRHRLP